MVTACAPGVPAGENPGLVLGTILGVAATHGMDKLTLELEDDRFVLDNRLPLVRPQSKTLAIPVAENEGFRAVFVQMLRIAEPLSMATGGVRMFHSKCSTL